MVKVDRDRSAQPDSPSPDGTGKLLGEGMSREGRMGEWVLGSVSVSSHTGVWEGEHFGGSGSPRKRVFGARGLRSTY